jgi:poly(ADP-ribose) glycohydrolase ARH3
MRSKFRGCLLGAALGDALCSPFEGMPSPDRSTVYALLLGGGGLRYTDDTHMTIGVAESLLAKKGQFDGEHMATVLARNYRAEPWRGYGAGPPIVFGELDEGVPWHKAAEQLFGGAGSFGNGSAMRVAPVALATIGRLPMTVQMARETSRITHTHELALQGASLQACAINLLLALSPDAPFDRAGFQNRVTEAAQAPAYLEKLEQVRTLLEGASSGREVVVRLGNGIEAIRSVPTALYCFLVRPMSFLAVMCGAVRLGGDTDTIASMAGALSGAYLGEEALPSRLINRLEDAARLVDLADSFFSLTLKGSELPATPATYP